MDNPSRWKNNGLPRKGWRLIDVDEIETLTECDWCGTIIRYAHLLEHDDADLDTIAGCICAQHLTQDYVNPQKREHDLRKFSEKRTRWINSPKWIVTDKGNIFRKDDSVLIFNDKKNYMLKIGNTWGKLYYKTVLAAKKSAFHYLYN